MIPSDYKALEREVRDAALVAAQNRGVPPELAAILARHFDRVADALSLASGLQDEIAKRQEAFTGLMNRNTELYVELKRLQDEIERLKAENEKALDYVQHKSDCSHWKWNGRGPRLCTCGRHTIPVLFKPAPETGAP